MSPELNWRNNWNFYVLSTALFVFYLWLLFVAFHPKVTEEYKAYYIDQSTEEWRPKHYIATFEDGIDFSRDGWPTFVKSAYGFSHKESWGRWADARLLPVAKIIFAEFFTGYVCLELETIASKKQLGKAVIVRMGGEEKSFLPSTDNSEIHKVEFVLGQPAAALEVKPTAPGTPKEWESSNTDPRKIGLGFLKLGIAKHRCRSAGN